MNKTAARLRRSRKTRARINDQNIARLTVHRTSSHIYAQVIVVQNNVSKVVACASTLEKQIMNDVSGTKSELAKAIGLKIAERAIKAGVNKVAFDRSGFLFHGRVKALADGAREGGLDF